MAATKDRSTAQPYSWSSRAVRALHITQPTDAGVANVVLALAAYQHQQGLDVVVASPRSDAFEAALSELGVRYAAWPASRGPLTRSTWSEIKAVRKLVAQYEPDFVHLHSSKAGLAGRLAIRRSVSTLFQPHAWSDEAASWYLRPVVRLWERIATRYTDAVICGSAPEAQHGLRLGVQHIAIVHNGVDTARFSPRDRALARERLGVPTNARLAICVGRLAHQKGQDDLLAMWPRVEATIPSSRLALIGRGPLERSLRDTARGLRVDFDVSCSDPRDWYAASDVVVAPSRWEGAALVPLEAMAMGRSVVGYDVGGLGAVLADGRGVVAPGDSKSLESALRSRLAADAQSEDSANRRRAVEKYSIGDTCAQISAIALGIVGGFERQVGS